MDTVPDQGTLICPEYCMHATEEASKELLFRTAVQEF